MKKFNRLLISLFFLIVMIAQTVLPVCAGYPKAQDYVADEAGLLKEETIKQIKKINSDLFKDTKIVIAVCTVKSTGEQDIAAYSRSLYTEWKLGEGILLLISSEDNSYYFVPSVGIEDIMSAETITSVRDEYFQNEFLQGNIDRAVQRTAIKLKGVILDGIKARAAAQKAADEEAAEKTENGEEDAKEKTPALIVVLKLLLWVIIIAVLLFAAWFILAMFNDDAAELMRKYIFDRFNKRVQSEPEIFDERLYGNRQRQVRAAEQRQQMYGGYGNAGGNGYGYQGQRRNGYPQNTAQRPAPNQVGQLRAGNGYEGQYPAGGNAQYRNPQAQNPPRQAPMQNNQYPARNNGNTMPANRYGNNPPRYNGGTGYNNSYNGSPQYGNGRNGNGQAQAHPQGYSNARRRPQPTQTAEDNAPTIQFDIRRPLN